MRLRAIWFCLWYGIRPWWMYEGDCHHAPMSYSQHLRMNLAYAFRWATGRETAEDVEFEEAING